MYSTQYLCKFQQKQAQPKIHCIQTECISLLQIKPRVEEIKPQFKRKTKKSKIRKRNRISETRYKIYLKMSKLILEWKYVTHIPFWNYMWKEALFTCPVQREKNKNFCMDLVQEGKKIETILTTKDDVSSKSDQLLLSIPQKTKIMRVKPIKQELTSP